MFDMSADTRRTDMMEGGVESLDVSPFDGVAHSIVVWSACLHGNEL